MLPGLAEQYECVARELRLRRKVYPKLVAEARMTQTQARQELERMQAVLRTLGRLIEHESGQMDMFMPGEKAHANGASA